MTPKLSNCRVCGDELQVALDMGELYPSAFLAPDEPLPEKLPMVLAKCANCGLVQLLHDFDLDQFYRQYYYQSGINPSMVQALQDVVKCALERVELQQGDVVVDIGANDLTTLSLYPDDLVKVAYEPARNLPKVMEPDYFINDYFSEAAYPLDYSAKIVTSLAMFYDLPDPVQFARDVSSILHMDGIWIMQISDLCQMLKTNSIDNPCFEHVEYYCTADILNIVGKAGLEVFRIEKNSVNSGSLRFYIAWKGNRVVEDSVMQIAIEEQEYFDSPEGSIQAFAKRVDRARENLVGWLRERKQAGAQVYALAASTKGNTLLQYFGIDHSLIVAVGDLNPEKYGKVMVGSNIPIWREQEVMDAKPDAVIILSWHFLKFFLQALKPYMLSGGSVITPLPTPKLYYMEPDDPDIVAHVPLMLMTGVESGD